MTQDIEQAQIAYFERYYREHGVSAEGLNYGTKARQQLCFAQAARIITHPTDAPFTLNDYGCGFADLLPFLGALGYDQMRYTGYDVTPAVLEAARERYASQAGVSFVANEGDLPPADYTVAVGVFNVKEGNTPDAWRRYVLSKLDELWAKSHRGLAFNILTKYSDADKMRDNLYYADPLFYFDYCKQHYSRNVALLHDYGVYEFTILVRED